MSRPDSDVGSERVPPDLHRRDDPDLHRRDDPDPEVVGVRYG